LAGLILFLAQMISFKTISPYEKLATKLLITLIEGKTAVSSEAKIFGMEKCHGQNFLGDPIYAKYNLKGVAGALKANFAMF
jgi:hypothetical protein